MNYISEKVGGIENLMIIMLVVLIVILSTVHFRLDFLIGVFQNMCFYEYPTDYICSCSSKFGQSIDLSNFTVFP